MEEPEYPETESENAPPPSSEGYVICVTVRPDGFLVSDPQPLEDTSDESASPEPSGELVPDQMTMVKHLLHVIKENPLGADAEAQMAEGFEEGPAKSMPAAM